MLLDLLPFLEAVVRTQVPDLRDVVRSYDGTPDIPAAFRERMKAVQDKQQRQKAEPKGLLSGFVRR